MRQLVLLLFGCFLAFTSALDANSQKPSAEDATSGWTVAVHTDRMTDQQTLTATAAASLGSSSVYHLTFTCDGTERRLTIGTFNLRGEGREMLWGTRVIANPFEDIARMTGQHALVSQRRAFRYRLDDDAAQIAELTRGDYVNVGNAAIGIFTLPVRQNEAADAPWTLKPHLPVRRLLVSDIFPDETVEFSFAALSAAQREQLTSACFRPELRMAADARAKLTDRSKLLAQARYDRVYRDGETGIGSPRLLREVKPSYTGEAMKKRIAGVVGLEVTVMPDGSMTDVKVVRSLDAEFGLDNEAVSTVKQWQFAPGTKEGAAVPVRVEIEMTFELR